MVNHSFYIDLALAAAWKYQGLTLPNPAVGAVVVDKNGKILGVGAHEKAGLPHAEVNAIKNSFLEISQDEILKNDLRSLTNSHEIHDFLIKHSQNIFEDGTIYVTLEPCNHTGKTPACSNLIGSLKFKKVVFSQKDPNKSASGGEEYLRSLGVEVISAVREKEGRELLEPFILYQKKNFVLYKWAQRLNGTYTGGKVSCPESFKDVHRIRDVVDLIVIGGETVREDRPTLDARLVDGKAPDVLILSRKKEFDKTIPLFNVKNREVIISDNVDLIDNCKYVLIEGGKDFYTFVKKKIDFHLIYQSSTTGDGVSMNSVQLEYLKTEVFDKDLKIWGR